MLSLVTSIALAHNHAAQPFDDVYYATIATVIPVLFLAIAIQVAVRARAEAVSQVLYEHMCGLGAAEMVTPKLAGARSPEDIWKAAEAHTARLRAQFGLNPVAYAG